jgi:predicted nucleotidyltransferase
MLKKPKYTVEEIRQKIVPIAIKYEIMNVFLFGSYARNEAKVKSDIDLRIDVKKGTGYFKLCEIHGDLEDVFHIKVDLLTTGALDDKFLNRIAKEEVLLYAE